MRCLFLLRLAELVTLESVFQQSFENRSIAKFCTNLAGVNRLIKSASFLKLLPMLESWGIRQPDIFSPPPLTETRCLGSEVRLVLSPSPWRS